MTCQYANLLNRMRQIVRSVDDGDWQIDDKEISLVCQPNFRVAMTRVWPIYLLCTLHANIHFNRDIFWISCVCESFYFLSKLITSI